LQDNRKLRYRENGQYSDDRKRDHQFYEGKTTLVPFLAGDVTSL
jgi:hypothetical protein